MKTEVLFCEHRDTINNYHTERFHMRFRSVDIRLALLPIALSVAGCTSPVLIGDQSKPLMPPGEGLVASSVVFQNKNAPDFMKFSHAVALYGFTYEPVEGHGGEQFTIGVGHNTVKANSKNPRSKDDDGPPILMMLAAKPGTYRLRDVSISTYPYKNSVTFGAGKLPHFEIKAGQVTYVGNMRLNYRTGWDAGTLTPRSYYLTRVNDFDTDIAEMKGMEPRLLEVVVTNGLGK